MWRRSVDYGPDIPRQARVRRGSCDGCVYGVRFWGYVARGIDAGGEEVVGARKGASSGDSSECLEVKECERSCWKSPDRISGSLRAAAGTGRHPEVSELQASVVTFAKAQFMVRCGGWRGAELVGSPRAEDYRALAGPPEAPDSSSHLTMPSTGH